MRFKVEHYLIMRRISLRETRYGYKSKRIVDVFADPRKDGSYRGTVTACEVSSQHV